MLQRLAFSTLNFLPQQLFCVSHLSWRHSYEIKIMERERFAFHICLVMKNAMEI